MYNTSDMINEIYRIFTALNEHYFESSLPTPFITSENEENDTMNERWLQLGEKLNLKFNK